MCFFGVGNPAVCCTSPKQTNFFFDLVNPLKCIVASDGYVKIVQCHPAGLTFIFNF